MNTLYWCLGLLFLMVAIPTLAQYLFGIIVALLMWKAHEKFGWFGGYQSSSDAPRMHVHPREDKI